MSLTNHFRNFLVPTKKVLKVNLFFNWPMSLAIFYDDIDLRIKSRPLFQRIFILKMFEVDLGNGTRSFFLENGYGWGTDKPEVLFFGKSIRKWNHNFLTITISLKRNRQMPSYQNPHRIYDRKCDYFKMCFWFEYIRT